MRITLCTFDQLDQLNDLNPDGGLFYCTTPGHEGLHLVRSKISDTNLQEQLALLLPFASTGAFSVKTVGIDYLITNTDTLVIATEPINILLPPANESLGKLLLIKNAGSGSVSVLPDGDDRINGEASQPILGDSVMDIVSDGTNWHIV